MTYTVRAATRTDAEPLVAVLAIAFHYGSLAEWLVPDPDERRTVHHRYFADAFAHGLEHGTVHTAGAQSAVAIWYAQPEAPAADSDQRRAVLETIAGSHASKFLLLEETCGAWRPEQPHHHLAYLAVDPRRQRQGLGSALLAAHHRRLGQRNLPAYVIATNLRNRRFHRRHGYTTDLTLALPDSGPTLYRMRRTPTNAHPHSPTRIHPHRRSL